MIFSRVELFLSFTLCVLTWESNSLEQTKGFLIFTLCMFICLLLFDTNSDCTFVYFVFHFFLFVNYFPSMDSLSLVFNTRMCFKLIDPLNCWNFFLKSREQRIDIFVEKSVWKAFNLYNLSYYISIIIWIYYYY